MYKTLVYTLVNDNI